MTSPYADGSFGRMVPCSARPASLLQSRWLPVSCWPAPEAGSSPFAHYAACPTTA